MATPGFLIRLMQFTGLSRSIKLGPEDSEAYRFAIDLRAAALEGRLLCVFLHPANELAGITRIDRQGRRRALPQEPSPERSVSSPAPAITCSCLPTARS